MLDLRGGCSPDRTRSGIDPTRSGASVAAPRSRAHLCGDRWTYRREALHSRAEPSAGLEHRCPGAGRRAGSGASGGRGGDLDPGAGGTSLGAEVEGAVLVDDDVARAVCPRLGPAGRGGGSEVDGGSPAAEGASHARGRGGADALSTLARGPDTG